MAAAAASGREGHAVPSKLTAEEEGEEDPTPCPTTVDGDPSAAAAAALLLVLGSGEKTALADSGVMAL